MKRDSWDTQHAWDKINAQSFTTLVTKPACKRPFVGGKRQWEDNINVDPQKVGSVYGCTSLNYEESMDPLKKRMAHGGLNRMKN